MSTIFKQLAIEKLSRGKYQPRQDFEPKALQELANSIRAQGLIEPLIVRCISCDSYEIIAGERRWRAAQLAGLRDIPCIIKDYNDEQAAAISLVENVQREDLNLMEEATAYQQLMDEFYLQQEEVAALVGKSRSHIANILRLLCLSEPVQALVRKRQLSLGHARMLVSLPFSQQEILAQKASAETWSVRRLEAEVRTQKSCPTPTEKTSSNKDVRHLENSLAEQLGAAVQINYVTNEGGWLKIKFYDNDTLTGLLDRMGLDYD